MARTFDDRIRGRVSAEEYGVPQTRKRAVLVARRRHPLRQDYYGDPVCSCGNSAPCYGNAPASLPTVAFLTPEGDLEAVLAATGATVHRRERQGIVRSLATPSSPLPTSGSPRRR